MTTQERKNVFNTIHPTCLFKSTDLNIMIEDIKEETIQKYLDIFSININQISSSEDTKKIIEYDNEYVFPFLNEFCTFLFNDCEKRIIDYYKNNNKHEKYYLARGKAFEKYVNNILKNMYSDVKTNVNYIDNENRKMELDNLIITDELCLNFECKSSGFNVYNYDSDKETIQNMKSAFGRGYLSVNTFHNTVKMNNGIIEFFDGKFKKNYNLNNHKIVSFNVTMYPIEFLSTCIHYFDEKLSNSIQFFPITINVMDLYCIFILGIYNKKLVEYYIIERFNSINKMHKFKIDNDEINAFGYITDFNLKNGYSFMKEINNDIAELNISISNNLYREEINSVMANYGFRLLIDTIFKEELKNIVIKIISKE